ncbi:MULTISPECIES: GtrA family protein [Enterobacteriaceae]|nr:MULTISPECIES: GtrA family protein [Enterobacteriaceae]MCK7169428.1 GtrA family protein [Enterobacter chengduensis]MCM8030813.1 GtrA family protein [Enterobacter chengduensis]QLR51868.1 GtrA family protein [Citrobacter freundii]
MLKLFSKYLTVGVFNTAIHWFIFATGVYMFSVNQAAANFLAFATAVTFSFFANATFTFKAKPRAKGYFLFVGFMGLMSILVGKISDYYQIDPVITLVEFSLISLVCGFFYSKHIVFREEK